MKATFGNSFAKRSLVIAVTALPSLYSGLASAQTAPPPPAPAAPAPAAPAVPAAAPVAAPAAPPPAPEPAPAVVTPPVSETPPAPATVPPEVPPAPGDPDAETYKHINMGVWMRTGFAMQNASNPKKLDGIGMGGEAELHFSNTMRKGMSWTANFVATYGAPDGGSFKPGNGPPGDGAQTGTVAVLDLIAQYEPNPAFNVWVGRMLVASDRSNFSGPYFMAPWIYPLFLGPQGNPYAVVGPKEGYFGRNDGATVWGGFGEGKFKYYLGAYNMFDAAQKPLISGRLGLSLLSPEPGYYSSSTYLGKDMLSIGVGGQYQKNGDGSRKPTGPMGMAAGTPADYGMILADVLFEKKIGDGALDLEGAFYKYVGDGQPLNFSYMGLASYLFNKFQPLVRLQQAKQKKPEDGGGGNTVSMIDAQLGYYLDGYGTRMALGFAHSSDGADQNTQYSNSVFAGIQLQK